MKIFENAKEPSAIESERQTIEGADALTLAEAEGILNEMAGNFFPADSASRRSAASSLEELRQEMTKAAESPNLEALYRTLVEQIPAVVFMAFLDKGISEAYVSPQIEAMLGFTQAESLNDPVRWYRQIHPDDKSRWSIETAQMFVSGRPLRSVYRVIANDGRVVWFQCEAKVVRREDQRPWFVHGVAFDITEVKQAEEALRQSEERYRDLVENVGDIIYRISADGHFLWVNPTATRIMGYSEEEFVGMHFLDLIREDWREAAEKFYARQLYKKIPTTYFEFPAIAKDGRRVWIGQNVHITIANDQVLEMHAIARDITERKRAEEALRHSESLLRSVIEGTPDAIFVKDVEGRYLLINSAMASFIGKPVEKILGRNDFDLYPPEVARQFIEDDQQVALSGRTQTFEGQATSADGITRDYSVTKAVSRDHEGKIIGVIGISRDITTRKQSEEELHESEERYRIITETATEAIITIDQGSKMLLVNAAVERIFGYTREELLGKSLTMLMPEYLRHVHEAGLKRYLRTRKRHLPWAAVEVPGRHKSGKEIAVELSLGEFIKEGKHFFTGIVHDISQRKRAEEVLRRENAFVDLTQTVAVAANEASTIEDAVWHCLDKICVLTKWPVGHLYVCAEDDVNALVPTTLWHIDDPKRFDDFVQMTEKTRLASGTGLPGRVHASQKPAWIIDVTKDDNFPRAEAAAKSGIKSGLAFPILVFPTKIGTDKPEVVAVLEFFSTEATEPDEKLLEVLGLMGAQLGRVVERQRAEAALRGSEERFASFMRNLPGVATIKDMQGQYIYANETFEDTFRLKPSDWRGKTDDEVWPGGVADYFKEHDRRVLASQDVLQVTEAVPQHDGLHYWLVNKFPILDDEQTPVMVGGIAIDITEQKQAEEELAQKAEELARSNAELEQFAYVASHDLQEPLRMVSSYTQLLARRYKGQLDADADEFISYAVDGASRMQRLIQDLLEYSRIGTKGKEFKLTDCEAVLDRTLENLKMAIEEKGAEVTRDPLPVVMADEVQVGQLFQNLIGNGMKFCKDKSPRVHISAEQQENEWLFSVRDNGIGIAAEYAERIFVIFQRLHGKTEYAGTGIGLAVCKKIVERHGGRIWMESQVGEGTTFYFTLPNAYRGSPKLLFT